jgi:hypothetical protein
MSRARLAYSIHIGVVLFGRISNNVFDVRAQKLDGVRGVGQIRKFRRPTNTYVKHNTLISQLSSFSSSHDLFFPVFSTQLADCQASFPAY